MELADLIVRIIEAIIWPITILILIWIFRNQLSKVLLKLSKLRIKDIELEFNKDLQEAEHKAKELNLVTLEEIKEIPEPISLSTLYERIFHIAGISPRAAITEAWRTIELYTMQAAKAQGIEVSGAIAGAKTISILIGKGKLEEEIIQIYENLRRMRNKAAHAYEFDINSEEAIRYVDVALSIANRLRRLCE